MTALDIRSARPDQLVSGEKSQWEIIVGLEVHAQVTSNAKLFSGASAAYGGDPNAHVSLVDAAMPGMLPVINKFCVEQAIRTGLGLNAEIHRVSRFDRKNYFYPDLPQGYQISQFAMPIVGEGEIEVEPDGEEPLTIRIERLHLEQDAGKSIHDLSPTETYVDLNRSGVALMEIVSRPDMRSSKEAAAYFNKLRAIVRALGTCDGNMEEGSMRADVNVSVRKAGTKEWGTRCEIKNVNSTRFMMQAIEYEARRQIEILESGGTIDQETRLFDANTGETRTMRSKEDAHDYRYFPDPDLLPLVLEEKWIEDIRKSLPELPDAKKFRYAKIWKLNREYTSTLIGDLALGDEFEELVKLLLMKGGVGLDKIDEIFGVARLISKARTTVMSDDELKRQLRALPKPIYAEVHETHGLDGVLAHLEELGHLYWGDVESAAGMLCVSVRGLAAERREEAADLANSSRENLAALILLIKDGTINGKIAKDVFTKMMETGEAPGAIVEREGLKQVTDTGAIEKAIDDLIASNADKVADVKKNPKAFGWWVGQTMKATGGKANPAKVNEILKKKLGV